MRGNAEIFPILSERLTCLHGNLNLLSIRQTTGEPTWKHGVHSSTLGTMVTFKRWNQDENLKVHTIRIGGKWRFLRV